MSSVPAMDTFKLEQIPPRNTQRYFEDGAEINVFIKLFIPLSTIIVP